MVYAPDETLQITPAANALVPTNSSLLLDYDLGFRSASLSAGYAFNTGVRAELEAGYRRNELEILSFDDSGSLLSSRGSFNTGASDAVDTFTGFANLYYDFHPQIAVQPYLGVGVGVADTRYRTSVSTLSDFSRIETPLFTERDTTLAWQVMLGASTALTPRTRLSAEYRYWQTGKISFTDTAGTSYGTRIGATQPVRLRPSQDAINETQHSAAPLSLWSVRCCSRRRTGRRRLRSRRPQ